MDPPQAGVKTNRIGIGDEMDLMAAVRQFQPQFRGDDSASTVCWVAGNADFHVSQAIRCAAPPFSIPRENWQPRSRKGPACVAAARRREAIAATASSRRRALRKL